MTVKGTVSDPAAGSWVRIEYRRGGEWRRLGSVKARGTGFTFRFVPHIRGWMMIKARLRSQSGGSQKDGVTVFHRGLATWYGPGFYGNSTACGQVYDESILGVAHRTLPCGTWVTLLYNGIVLSVPVIDRGPYSSADWDLSAGTAKLLGFSGLQQIGVLRAFAPGH